jgi:cytochrome c
MSNTLTMRRLFLGGLALFVGLAGALSRAEPADPEVQRGQRLFLRCAACHAIGSGGGARIGPNLQGVVGRKAGSLAGFAYTPALQATDFVWDEAHLDRWLTRPAALVPGTAMAFAGLAKAEDRAAIIAYLRSSGGPS